MSAVRSPRELADLFLLGKPCFYRKLSNTLVKTLESPVVGAVVASEHILPSYLCRYFHQQAKDNY